MPQLDHVTFFTQIFWLVIVFLSLYIIMITTYLPKIAAILKSRTILMADHISSIKSANKEVLNASTSEMSIQQIKLLKKSIINIGEKVNVWYTSANNFITLNLNPINKKIIMNNSVYSAFSAYQKSRLPQLLNITLSKSLKSASPAIKIRSRGSK